MIVEIHGGGFHNKGAELMLRTAVEEVKQRIADVQFAVDPFIGHYEERCTLGLKQIIPFRLVMGHPHFRRLLLLQKITGRLFPQRMIQRYGCVTLNQIDALLDISGFAFSDQWGIGKTRNFSALAQVYKQSGKPVILLPQALGPFRKGDTKQAFLKILAHADLVYTRDQQSYEYVIELGESSDRVHLAPDITLFYRWSPEVVDKGETASYGCVIPSYRMLDQGAEEWGEGYINVLIGAIQEMLAHSLPVQIIVHDASGEDLRIVNQLAQQFKSDQVSVVKEGNTLKLREIIGKSRIVVGSRYHGLVAAFSRGVPSVCMGWSHKYEMLFRDFGCEDLVVGPNVPLAQVRAKIASLLDHHTNDLYRRKIITQLEQLEPANRAMWEQVCDILAAHQDRRT